MVATRLSMRRKKSRRPAADWACHRECGWEALHLVVGIVIVIVMMLMVIVMVIMVVVMVVMTIG